MPTNTPLLFVYFRKKYVMPTNTPLLFVYFRKKYVMPTNTPLLFGRKIFLTFLTRW
jgi:hypothetical protein